MGSKPHSNRVGLVLWFVMRQEHYFQSHPPVDAKPQLHTTHPHHVQHIPPPSRDEVARRAYFLYQNEGCPQGRDVQHWLEAEAEMVNAAKSKTSGS
jgi:hypothetical protein